MTRTFTVSPAELTITARNRTIVYGQTPAPFGYDNSRPTVTVTGVVCSAPTSPGVGTHPITCSGGDAGPNYAISYVTGTLTVTAAPAKVTVSPPTVQYSDPVPNLNVVGPVSGLVGTDMLAGSLTGCAASGTDGGGRDGHLAGRDLPAHRLHRPGQPELHRLLPGCVDRPTRGRRPHVHRRVVLHHRHGVDHVGPGERDGEPGSRRLGR